MTKLKVTLKRSLIGTTQRQRATVSGLGCGASATSDPGGPGRPGNGEEGHPPGRRGRGGRRRVRASPAKESSPTISRPTQAFPGSRRSLSASVAVGVWQGKTAGRGTKGQHARSTVKRGFEGGRCCCASPPEARFTNIFKKDYATVRLDLIAARFAAGDVVDVDALRAKGLARGRQGRYADPR